MDEKLLKVQDVMARLNVSRRTIYYWIDQGILKPIRLGNIYRFHPEDIDQLIESSRTAPAIKHKKILAIDDDILVRESIKTLLGRAGYSVTVVPDGKAAITMVQQQDFDLTLTDMRMPGMDGLATLKAIRKIRQDAGKSPMPEIIMTAYEDSHAKAEAELMGVKKFVMKPFELSYFLDVIEQNIS